MKKKDFGPFCVYIHDPLTLGTNLDYNPSVSVSYFFMQLGKPVIDRGFKTQQIFVHKQVPYSLVVQ